jgi:hypothetical protein
MRISFTWSCSGLCPRSPPRRPHGRRCAALARHCKESARGAGHSSWLAAAFRPEAAGRSLTFRADAQGVITDVETGSRWNVAGIAKEGPLAGHALPPWHYVLEEWYAWATQHPGASLAGKE